MLFANPFCPENPAAEYLGPILSSQEGIYLLAIALIKDLVSLKRTANDMECVHIKWTAT